MAARGHSDRWRRRRHSDSPASFDDSSQRRPCGDGLAVACRISLANDHDSPFLPRTPWVSAAQDASHRRRYPASSFLKIVDAAILLVWGVAVLLFAAQSYVYDACHFPSSLLAYYIVWAAYL